jgi:alpha-D-xyloside xylohydrolase
MGTLFSQIGDALVRRDSDVVIRIEPWGPDCLRVRAAPACDVREGLPGALLPAKEAAAVIAIEGATATITSGLLAAHVTATGEIAFTRTSDGVELLKEVRAPGFTPTRLFRPLEGDLFQLEAHFAARPDERFYGLGQHLHGALDQKGAVIDLRQQNTSVCIPFLVSSQGYGFLWNNPALGRVELGANRTRWVADATYQLDYVVMTGAGYGDILRRYADCTGYPPMLPEFAAGFWQCKMRYANQQELLNVAREHHRRGLPLSVIVVDFMHWPHQGDWKWDAADWPDPTAMIAELKTLGIELMVSVWPAVSRLSENWAELYTRQLLIRTKAGQAILNTFPDAPAFKDLKTMYNRPALLYFYDATQPEARQFLWEKLKQHYYDIGCRVFWLDACEPDMYPDQPENLRYALGDGRAVGNLYPLCHQQGVYEGLRDAGEREIVTLCRSAWAGSQRYGAAVWSGDIGSTWDDLARSVSAGLNMAMSGIPWWTTDIGGFSNGNIHDPDFRELIVRWFQYGAFCPLFRLHGFREPQRTDIFSGTDNEVWSFGDEAYRIIAGWLRLREALRPYVMAQMRVAHETGTPPMRPLFFDFSADPRACGVEDQFLFGPDLLVAPITRRGQREREVYLPAGADWRDAWTDDRHVGGQAIRVDAPLERIAIFVREGALTDIAFAETLKGTSSMGARHVP